MRHFHGLRTWRELRLYKRPRRHGILLRRKSPVQRLGRLPQHFRLHGWPDLRGSHVLRSECVYFFEFQLRAARFCDLARATLEEDV